MKTLAFVTQKGGAGKTTLAASLAVAACEAGEKVALLDLDPQQSLAAWSDTRDVEEPAFDTLDASQVKRLNEILPILAEKGFTYAFLDTAGIDGAGTHLALQAANMALIPSRPTTMDIRATKATHEAAVRMAKPYAFILNQCPPQPNNPRAKEAAAGLKMWGVLAEPSIMQRAAQQDAFASGRGVTEYDPNSKAASEITQLWGWIKNKVEGLDHGKTTKLVS
ncbi:MAG: AAA family ATPase [Gammaproteobacteria bacterium]